MNKLFFVLVFAMIVMSMSVLANSPLVHDEVDVGNPNLLFFDDFNRVNSSTVGNMVFPDDITWVEVEDQGGSYSISDQEVIGYMPPGAGGGPDLLLQSDTNLVGNLTFEFDIDRRIGESGILFQPIFDGEYTDATLYFQDGGSVRCHGNQSYDLPYDTSGWHHYKMQLNIPDQTMSMYVDDIPICENAEMGHDGPNTYISAFRFYIWWGQEYDLSLDNFLAYQGFEYPEVMVIPPATSSSSSHTRYMVDANGNVVGVAVGNQVVTIPQEEKGSFLSLTGGTGFDFVGWLKGLWAQLAGIFGGE